MKKLCCIEKNGVIKKHCFCTATYLLTAAEEEERTKNIIHISSFIAPREHSIRLGTMGIQWNYTQVGRCFSYTFSVIYLTECYIQCCNVYIYIHIYIYILYIWGKEKEEATYFTSTNNHCYLFFHHISEYHVHVPFLCIRHQKYKVRSIEFYSPLFLALST